MLTALLLAAAPVGTTEGRWVSIGTDGNGAAWWLDGKTAPAARGSGGMAWFKIVPKASARSDVRDELMRLEIDCPLRRYATAATIIHYKDGRSSDNEIGSSWVYPAPDTVAEWIVSIMCDK